MDFCIIISTMNQKNFDLLKKINVFSDAIVINQCGKDKEYNFEFNNKKIKWIDSSDTGLSNSRNRALKEVVSDIVLMVDDDETLYENTEELVLSEFSNLNADLIAFNINGTRKRYVNINAKKLSVFNAFRYGSARLAFKTAFIKKFNITLDNRVGAGAKISCGEDSIFIQNFLKNKGKCYSSPVYIADICDDSSTWFKEYDEKFFSDKASVFKIMFPRMWRIISLRYLIKHYKITSDLGFFRCLRIMLFVKHEL